MPRKRKSRKEEPAKSPRKQWDDENISTLSGVTSDYESASTRGDFVPQEPPRTVAVRASSPHETGRLEPPINADEIHEPESESRKRHVAEFSDTRTGSKGRQREFNRHARAAKPPHKLG